jgi:hypothetical protein
MENKKNVRLEGRSKAAPHNEEPYMDCIVKDLNYGGINVEFEQAYSKGNMGKDLKEKGRDMVKESRKEMGGKSYKPEATRKMAKRDMQEY